MAGKPKGTSKVSSADVARLAAVSRSAVSRAFTPGAYVSAETRAKVMRAADLLGYRPNLMARSLITSRTDLVGIVTTGLDNPFYAQLLEVIVAELQKVGLASLTFIADEASNDELISRLLSYRVDALILTSPSLSSKMALRCAQGETPVVSINRYLNSDSVTSVVCDNQSSAADVADLFVAMGRQRIAFMGGQPDTSSSRDREQGFRQRLAARGVALHGMACGDYDCAGGTAAARKLLAADPPPDAIFCANDLMAMATIDVARSERGLRVPQDLAVVGFDNSTPAAWPAYDLTSVDQNITSMVRLALDELRGLIAGEIAPGRHLFVPGQIVRRGSAMGDPG